jgi:trans-2,3-dihydro-3-hydroxyanthranilate isomerase
MTPTKSFTYHVVDVFTERALEGNPLAVFPDASGLDETTMQRVARELNLSETVFVFPPSRADFAVSLRIFTPARELPFAGHPTVGTAFVLLGEGKISEQQASFLFEERIGPVPVRIETGASPLIWLETPSIHQGPTRSRELCARVLGLAPDDLLPPDPQILSAGNPTILIPVKSPHEVDKAWLELAGLQDMRGDYPDPVCAFVFAPTPEGAYSRMFAPDYGIAEDPATGSSTGPLAAYMLRHNLLTERNKTRFVSEQGTKMGRRSFLHVRIDSEKQTIEVGGYVAPLARAVMQL